jgi:hypothetical protein
VVKRLVHVEEGCLKGRRNPVTLAVSVTKTVAGTKSHWLVILVMAGLTENASTYQPVSIKNWECVRSPGYAQDVKRQKYSFGISTARIRVCNFFFF